MIENPLGHCHIAVIRVEVEAQLFGLRAPCGEVDLAQPDVIRVGVAVEDFSVLGELSRLLVRVAPALAGRDVF